MYSSAKKLQRVLSSHEIRKTFIEYFTKNHDHKFIRSSPVVPFCDPTVAFVNAGMNQFKSVFLGTTQPPFERVANSQKCVRIGGKHNDLSVVGEDSYHHTFFEMLGNWSFGDYFKREACSMALDLLKGPYSIDSSRLYVTYFAGDKILGLPADLECFEIWRSLGFPSSRILPFGTKDNFWEMGLTGPCGPCTEIHLDHRPDLAKFEDRSKLVNTGRSDLTELWNIVFIQYNRNEDGSITQLPAKHVDTGMGFERLTAVLQNKSSNYDTDLFMPIIDAIHKLSKAPEYSGAFPFQSNATKLDTAYRILADHVRMITVCLADGMLPDQNQKLRRVLRKALTLSENTFANENLLKQLIPVVVDSLGSAYPEIPNKQSAILELINHEQEVFKALRESSAKACSEILNLNPSLEDIDLIECPGFVPAYKELQIVKNTFTDNKIPGEFLHKLNDTYGLTEEHFQKLSQIEKMTYSVDDYQEALAKAKQKAKAQINTDIKSDKLLLSINNTLANLTKTLQATDNTPKYNYRYNEQEKKYEIPVLKSKVLGILYNDVRVEEVVCNGMSNVEDIVSIITEASNFYYESGGQEADKGSLLITTSENDRHELKVCNVNIINNCVVHMCKLPAEKSHFTLAVGDIIDLLVDSQHRKGNTCHHTATHLLNGAIRTLFNKVTYQVSSTVTKDMCKLEVGLIGKKIIKDDIVKIENYIKQIISFSIPVNVKLCNATEILQQNNVTMVPGEIYPETGLRLVSINCDDLNLLSKELCCGTHVTNTHELECFCVTNLKQTNRARYAFTALAGEAAEKAFKVSGLLKQRIDMLEKGLKFDKSENNTELELQKIRHNLVHMDVQLPYIFKMETLERINEILRKLKQLARTNVNYQTTFLLTTKKVAVEKFFVKFMDHELYADIDIVKRIKLQRLRWLGHAVRMEANAPAKKAFEYAPGDGSRRRGRPKLRWKDQVEEDISTLGVIIIIYNKIEARGRIFFVRLQEQTFCNSHISKELVEVEMRNVLLEKPIETHPFILHYISSSALMEEVPLQKATKLCSDRPVLVISKSDNIVKARCCVPEKFQSENFNAEKWLNEFATIFKSPVAAPRGQNPYEVCNMKGKKTSTEFEEQLEKAMRRANNFALEHLK